MATSSPLTGARGQIVLLVLAVVLLIGAVFSFTRLQHLSQRSLALENLAADVENLHQNIIQTARNASQGLEPDRAYLFALQENFDDLIFVIKEGDPARSIPPLAEVYAAELESLTQAWNELQPVVERITAGLPTAQRSKINAATIDEVVTRLRESTGQLAQGTAGAAATAAAQLRATLEELRARANAMIRIDARAAVTADHIAELLDAAEGATDRLGNLTGTSPAFEAVREALPLLRQHGEALIAAAPALDAFNEAAAGFLGHATIIETTGGALENQLLLDARKARANPLPTYFLAGGALLALTGFLGLFLLRQRRTARTAQEHEQQQQQAILMLLDEITNLADGDLTVDMTVTEDFTGAIADSLNYTVENMRSLVGQINAAAREIVRAADQTAGSAGTMSEASEEQAQQTAEATRIIERTSASLKDVAGRAQTASQQAQDSVRTAHTGAETVERTISGMNSLREQIQDTAKRMKRLGESSQEIGNITELINDIAEQTNTLALNASIQAAMAGEAGRGFAVVADEVQRLAERAGNATRQIESLVKTIQADTSEAIVSMERSTANVVSGAGTAEDAGKTLVQIERASTGLARLIDEIAGAVRDQSAEGAQVAATMQQIRETAVQTAQQARQTASDVGTLTALGGSLRESVAGFKLPESEH